MQIVQLRNSVDTSFQSISCTFLLLYAVFLSGNPHNLCLHSCRNHLIKVSFCFLSSAGYFILKSAGLCTRNSPFHCTAECGCCCNPQDAEQNPSWDFTPPSFSSSFPVLLTPSHPLASTLLITSLLTFLHGALPPHLHWKVVVMSFSLLGAGLITKTSKQVER